MTSGVMVSGLDCLVEAMEAAEAKAAASNNTTTTTTTTYTKRRSNATNGNSNTGFICPHPECGRVFSKRYNQQAHMRIHDGTKPFSCELCGKAFMWKSSLKSHAKMHAKIIAQGIAKEKMMNARQKTKRKRKNDVHLNSPKSITSVEPGNSSSGESSIRSEQQHDLHLHKDINKHTNAAIALPMFR